MMYVIGVIFSLLLIQLTSAQILQNGLRNFGNNPNFGFPNRGLAGNGLPLSRNFPNTNLRNDLESGLLSGFNNRNINPEQGAINLANSGLNNMANGLSPIMAHGMRPNMANGMRQNIINGLDRNIGFNLADNGKPFTLTGSENEDFGLQIMADALEIGGNIAVTGKMPIYGSVAVNGKVPSDGSAAVKYSCGGPHSEIL